MGLEVALLGPWHEYVTESLMPEFPGNPNLKPEADQSDQDYQHYAMLPDFAQPWMLNGTSAVGLDVRHDTSPLDIPIAPPVFESGTYSPPALGPATGQLERTVVAPGFRHTLGDRSQWKVSAILAYQSFNTWGFGAMQTDVDSATALYDGRETSAGTGIQVGLDSEIAQGLRIGASVRSEIDMDTFQSYRGVFSEPGNFDIPASARVGLALSTTSSSMVTFDVERILYSDIHAVTTPFMPEAVLSLLGDAGSPTFAWQDLTVYRLGFQWRLQDDMVWSVGVSSRQQPHATSELLNRALSPIFADRYLTLGVTKNTSDDGRLSLRGSYAPLSPDNRFLPNLYTDRRDEVEVEAIWSKDF